MADFGATRLQAPPPEFVSSDAGPSHVIGVAVAALPVLVGAGGPELGPGAAQAEDDFEIDLVAMLDDLAVTGKVGEVTRVPIAAGTTVRLLLLVGVGAGSASEVRDAAAELARAVAGRDSVASTLHCVGGDEVLAAFVEGAILGSFSYTHRTDGRPEPPVRRIVLADTEVRRPEVVAAAIARASASSRARMLASTPSNIKNPGWLADQAAALAAEFGLEIEVWDEVRLAKEGFGGLVAVGGGSATPPRFVRLGYVPDGARRRKHPHVVLVGKGITFDSGGLDIKPGESMTTMKRDMTGAGVVLSVMAALAAIDCQVRVTGLLCLAENAVGANSMRPGDVITHYGAVTSEVTNTDAEGRLVLADGMAYAVDKLSPDVLVDIATLTGAAKVALGLHTAALFSNDDDLAGALEDAAATAGEPVWRLPLAEIYAEKLASKIADQDNAAGGPGAITAALFLKRFAGSGPWAHLDIAPVGDSFEDKFTYSRGPTGFGARLLLEWLTSEGIAQ